jgi:NADH-quinone oxidoreductase subunit J
MMEAVCFYAFAALMLAAAGSVVFNRQPVYSVLSLLVVMLCLAALFVMLGAYFVAALQVLLYGGAVLVLFLFVIMLLNLEPEALARMRLFTLRGAGTGAALLLLWLLVRVLRGGRGLALSASPAAEGTVEAIGRQLFTTYLLPFELTSFLILAAIIGAVTLAKRNPNE